MASASAFRSNRATRQAGERGQAAIFLVFALGIFLIGGIGFVVDGANLWFHRQSAQTAADAACTSAAMDMLSLASGVAAPDPNWIPSSDDGTTLDCSGTTTSGGNKIPNSTFPPCQYAALNGYSGSGSQHVLVDFPSGLSFAADCPAARVCAADNIAATPYVRVTINDTVPTTFMRLVGAGASTPVPARSTCGLSNVLSPVPIVVLNPNAPNGVGSTLAGSGSLTVYSGALTSIQVNSTDSNAVNLSAATIELSNANGGQGGEIAVAGRESENDAGLSSTVKWTNAAGLVSDPFASVSAPKSQGMMDCTDITSCVDFGTSAGCPAGFASCDLYKPGYYPALQKTCLGAINGVAAICVGQAQPGNPKATGLAVFQPGVYYLGEDLYADATSCLRSATTGGDGSGGTVFYLSNLAVLDVASGSGGSCASPVAVSDATCPGGDLGLGALGITQLTGNVLLAPCTGTYGDPSGSGKVRGMLFFHDRDVQPDQSRWLGSGALVGNIYLHHCHVNPTGGSGANCDSDAFTETFNLGGSSTVVGGIVVDQLFLTGSVNVILNPNPQYYVLKASLLQ